MRWCAAGTTEGGQQFRRVNGTHTYPRCVRPSNAASPLKMSMPSVTMNP
jgi:hypothetical protein